MPVGVVLAEDNLLVREGVRRILEMADDVELLAVCSDQEGLAAALERERPDLVITDIRMPPGHGTEGIDTANELRVREPHVAVLVLSQYVDPHYAVSLFQHGSAR